jgi:CheY-like chemotaxis protein
MPHKLLLADDSVTIQRVIELTFADEDIQVIVVGDGKQAMDRIAADRPDIVLADIGMPERDGYEVAAFVKNDPQLAHIPVVLLTGAFEPLDENRARAVGCDGVLVKPFEPQMVINRVNELLAGQRAAARPAPAVSAVAPTAAPKPEPLSFIPADFDSDLAPAPPAPGQAQAEPDSLEDYFDRLDAAFANAGSSASAPVAAPVLEREDLGASITELHTPPPRRTADGDPLSTWDPDLSGDLTPGRQPHLANAFAALLAAEQGHASPHAAALVAPPLVSDETIEQIVQRVLARLADDSMRRLVVETAERLVREEIDRIKRMSAVGDR